MRIENLGWKSSLLLGIKRLLTLHIRKYGNEWIMDCIELVLCWRDRGRLCLLQCVSEWR